MINNPHTSSTFREIWFSHFNKSKSRTKFDSVLGIDFFKDNKGVFINAGHTHTKGITYQINYNSNLGDNALLVCDVPTYLQKNESQEKNKGIAIKKIKQYPGYLIELDTFSDLDDFMQQKFKKSSRYKLNKYKRRLNDCFDISCHMYTAEMDDILYTDIFTQFRNLLEKRFENKGEYNNNLDEQEWNFYKKVALPMLKEEKAGLFVVSDQGKPIAITLVYFSESIIFDAITVFDVDYAKFHLGSVNIMFLLEWALKNGYKILDFSKGHYDYKTRWATKKYDFEYHIIYNPSSPLSQLKSTLLINSFKTKQFLRDKGVNLWLNKFRYRLKRLGSGTSAENPITNNIQFNDFDPKMDSQTNKVDGYDPLVKRALFEFLYLFGERAKDVEVYQNPEKKASYIFRGERHCKVTLQT